MSIAVIIPSKTISNLVPCVEAVRKHEPTARIVVVDDGLPLSARLLPCMQGPVEFIEGAKPFCFSINVNVGIRKALEVTTIDVTTYGQDTPQFIHYGVDGVVVLNDDAILQTPGGFSLLTEAAREYPEFGIIGSTCNNVGNLNQFPRGIGLREEPRMVCFVAVYIPRTTIEAVGLLDERYVGYGMDDDDYSFEVHKAGLKIGIHDGCYVDHGSLISTFRGDPKTPADFRPNHELFKQKWGHDNRGKPC